MTLDELVKEALSSGDPGEPAPDSPDGSKSPETGTDIPGTGILVIGVGTAGTKIIGRLHQLAGPGLRTLAIDSSRESLDASSASSTFYLKPSYFSGGFGFCGGDPDLVERYAEATKKAMPDIEPLLGNPEFCFIVAGMGGNMGTAATPVIAWIMRERGAIVTAIVSHPFAVERKRIGRAAQAIAELGKITHTTLVLDFGKLGSALPKILALPQMFLVMDHIIALAIRNIWEGAMCDSLINYHREDLHTLLEQGGTGTLLLGEFSRDSGNKISFDEMRVPLLDFNHEAVKTCIIHISGGSDLGLYETEQIMLGLIEPFNPHADTIWAATVRNEMEGKLRMFTIVAGLNDDRRLPDESFEEWLAGP